jgi:hypothetical protein
MGKGGAESGNARGYAGKYEKLRTKITFLSQEDSGDFHQLSSFFISYN